MEHPMKLHEDSKLFQQAIRATSQHKGILEIYIEKDYWVTYVLNAIFHHEIGEQTVFKGGTALSKCFGMIERFSEDIDLVVMRSDKENDNQLKRKIKTISKVVEGLLPEVPADITQKMGMNRKTAHQYPKTFKGNFGQIRDVVVVEATWLGYYEPYTTQYVQTYIYDMMMSNGQEGMVQEYGLEPFPVKVLDPKRTLCEKIMSMVRFSYSSDPIDDLRKKIRHTYDIHKLLQHDTTKVFFNSDEFSSMLLKVAQDDVASYRNKNAWLARHPTDSIIFNDPEKIWSELKNTYNTSFNQLVFGKLPNEKEILNSLKTVASRLKSIDWKVDITP